MFGRAVSFLFSFFIPSHRATQPRATPTPLCLTLPRPLFDNAYIPQPPIAPVPLVSSQSAFYSLLRHCHLTPIPFLFLLSSLFLVNYKIMYRRTYIVSRIIIQLSCASPSLLVCPLKSSESLLPHRSSLLRQQNHSRSTLPTEPVPRTAYPTGNESPSGTYAPTSTTPSFSSRFPLTPSTGSRLCQRHPASSKMNTFTSIQECPGHSTIDTRVP